MRSYRMTAGRQNKAIVFAVHFAHDIFSLEVNPKHDREGEWWLPSKT